MGSLSKSGKVRNLTKHFQKWRETTKMDRDKGITTKKYKGRLFPKRKTPRTANRVAYNKLLNRRMVHR